MEQGKLEKEFLCQLLSSSEAMIRAQSANVSSDWFTYAEETDDRSYTQALFVLAEEYFNESDGLLLTLKNLGEKAAKHGIKESTKRKLFALFGEIKEIETDENDFHLLLSELKE